MIEGKQITYTGISNQSLQETADCLYTVIRNNQGNEVKKIDLSSKDTVYIEISNSGIIFARYKFTSISKDETKVELESLKPSALDNATGLFDKNRIAPLRSCGVKQA